MPKFPKRLPKRLSKLLSGVVLAGCGSSAVRPAGLSAAEGLGEALTCTPQLIQSSLSPFIAEWPDGERAALESEMAKGVALVRFSCEGSKVLRGCALPGVEYAYRGINKKSKVLQMNDAASVQANFSSFTLGGAAQAALTQGKALNLAYVMAGTMGHTVQVVNRGQIKADHCREATHFVIDAQVGAFTLATGERGQLVAAAQVFGFGGAHTDVSSQKNVASSDGDPKACEAARRSDSEPAEGCAALLQVGLVPVAPGAVAPPPAEVAAAADPRNCPKGFVFEEDGCVRAAQVQHFLCAPGDYAGCADQCTKGNDPSCGRLAAIVFDYDAFKAYEDDDPRLHLVFNAVDGLDDEPLSEKEAQVLSRYGRFFDRMKVACEAGEGDACALAATLTALRAGDDGPRDGTTLAAALPLVEAACAEGQGTACRTVIGVYGEGDYADAERYGAQAVAKRPDRLEAIVGRACAAGNGGACYQIGRFFYDPGQALADQATAVQPDPARAASYFYRACLGMNDAQACTYATAAALGADGQACAAALAAGLQKGEADFELFLPTDGQNARDISTFCGRMGGISEPAQAYYAADKACYLAKRTASADALCAFSKTLRP